VDPAGWLIEDQGGNPDAPAGATKLASPKPVPPGGYLVVASDSSFFRFFPGARTTESATILIPRQGLVSLNNEGDVVVLRDASKNMVDSVPYSPAWHNPSVTDRTGRSLERILVRAGSADPSNWTTCVVQEGGTPGRQNSASLPASRSGASLSCSPNPFSPDADGIDDFTAIHYLLPRGHWSLSATVFDVTGRRVRQLASMVPGGGQGDLIWDGRDDDRLRVRVGIYVVFVEAVDGQSGLRSSAKAVVVLAGKL
jgi:hypothetical protein